MAIDLHLVTYRVGKELFGVPIASVQEIVRVPVITSIPEAPDFVEGVINLRGKIITVVDMRKRLGHVTENGVPARDSRNRVLVVECAGRLVGVIVDEVTEVLRLGADRIDSAPPMVAGISNQYITGVGKLDDDLLILIDIEKILTADQLNAIAAVPAA